MFPQYPTTKTPATCLYILFRSRISISHWHSEERGRAVLSWKITRARSKSACGRPWSVPTATMCHLSSTIRREIQGERKTREFPVIFSLCVSLSPLPPSLISFVQRKKITNVNYGRVVDSVSWIAVASLGAKAVNFEPENRVKQLSWLLIAQFVLINLPSDKQSHLCTGHFKWCLFLGTLRLGFFL